MKKYYIGDSCLCWSIGDSIELEASLRILTAYRRLKHEITDAGVLDFVPSYNALAIHFDPVVCDVKALEMKADAIFETILNIDKDDLKTAGERIVIPVIYNGEDLNRMAKRHTMAVRDIIDIHKARNYTVAMIGFKPYFPYLIGLDERIETPRMKTPRLHVPAGSVAVGGAQTGIYPEESPGGWNLIGMTDPKFLKEISPGDVIEFKEVDKL